MKLLINDKEITHYLMSLNSHGGSIFEIECYEYETAGVINEMLEKRNSGKFDQEKHKKKFKEKLIRAVTRDLTAYLEKVKTQLENNKTYYYDRIHKNIEYFLKKLDEDAVLQEYKKSKKENFVKSIGLHIDKNSELVRQKDYTDYQEDCVLRNTGGNEHILISKIKNNYPFWFIDSGYTNFLETNKKWHRVERNHLHWGSYFQAPVDRLQNFKLFPKEWRTGGEKILIIEPGPFSAAIFSVDIKQWKYNVEAELRKYTDKKILFREKINKKIRTPLYEELCNDDYYCVVNINSNAATEAVWAGVPVITLDRHITNPVSTNNLKDINNLQRPHLANWLCMLSYSQFTYEELINGEALKIVKQYHV